MVLYMTFGQRTVDHGWSNGRLVNGRLVKMTIGQRTFGRADCSSRRLLIKKWSADKSMGLFKNYFYQRETLYNV